MNTVKISQLEIENVKRVKACMFSPSENGLTVIGGKNGQGKTSVLDAICWALGGERYRPGNAARDGSTIPPRIKLTLSNGLIVERAGKNSRLKVTDPSGKKSGQQLLNAFVGEFAINLPAFMEANNKEKADILLKTLGIGEQIAQLEQEASQIYNRRHAIGQEADRKKKFAEEMPFYPDVPNTPVSISELIQRQQEILAQNGQNQILRSKATQLRGNYETIVEKIHSLHDMLNILEKQKDETFFQLKIAEADAAELQDICTDQIEAEIADYEQINQRIYANNDRERAEQEADAYQNEYNKLTEKLEAVRKAKYDLLHGANLPLEGLAVDNGELTYHGKLWDCMSGSEQLKVSTAIVKQCNPACGFVLLDKLEQMDHDTLEDFGHWIAGEGLQAIATRVSVGPECSIIIEDGIAVEGNQEKTWKAGEF